jgi:hypothetical protein
MDYEAFEKNRDKIKDYDKLSRHLRRKVKVEITNEEGIKDEFEFYPASFEVYSRFMILAPQLENDKFSEESGKQLLDIMALIVKESYSDWPDDVCKQFVANNFESLMDVMERIMPQSKTDVDKIKKIQKKYNQFIKNEPQPGTTESQNPQ